LAAVNHALAQKWGARAAESIRRLTVLEPDTDLPMRWRSALERLQAQGTHLERSRFQPAPQAATDLGAMQRTLLGQGAGAIPLVSGDGSLGLLRSGGVIVAAEATAAWLAALRERVRDASIVVVNADPVLDDALARHGMPTTGSASSGVPPAMAVLPLALSLLWHPRDAARARELLLVPDGPVPFAVARALVAALDSWPAVGSPAWEWRLARALDGRADEEAVRLVLQVLFGPESVTRDGQPALPATPLPHGTPCPPDRLWALLDQLAAWWTGALADGAANAEGVWAQVGRQLASFRLLTTSALSFGASRAPGWSAPELMRLAEAAATDAERGASASARRPAQAGLSVVRGGTSQTPRKARRAKSA
jgi:hypothetical protein